MYSMSYIDTPFKINHFRFNEKFYSFHHCDMRLLLRIIKHFWSTLYSVPWSSLKSINCMYFVLLKCWCIWQKQKKKKTRNLTSFFYWSCLKYNSPCNDLLCKSIGSHLFGKKKFWLPYPHDIYLTNGEQIKGRLMKTHFFYKLLWTVT